MKNVAGLGMALSVMAATAMGKTSLLAGGMPLSLGGSDWGARDEKKVGSAPSKTIQKRRKANKQARKARRKGK